MTRRMWVSLLAAALVVFGVTGPAQAGRGPVPPPATTAAHVVPSHLGTVMPGHNTARRSGCTTCYYYGVASESPTGGADGLNVGIDVYKPTINTAKGDFHSLTEVAISNASQTNIVEFGWNVDQAVNGDQNTHLFTFYWVNGVPAASYNSGLVWGPGTACAGITSVPVAPGATLLTTTTPLTLKVFSLQHFVSGGLGAWWFSYNANWVGCLPDTLWTSAGTSFVKGDFFQMFGEVASSHDYGVGTKPCAQMGSGVSPAVTTTGAARMGNAVYVGNPNTPAMSWHTQSNTTMTPDYTVSAVNGRSGFYGGHTSATSPTC